VNAEMVVADMGIVDMVMIEVVTGMIVEAHEETAIAISEMVVVEMTIQGS
jgi:hypothetical protein